MAAVIKNGDALQYAYEALRADREVVMAAVNEVVMKVKKNRNAYNYISKEMKNNKDFINALKNMDL